MTHYRIKEVQSSADARLFRDVVESIYQGDRHYVRPLNKDIDGVFDPGKNKYFRHGRAMRWILFDERDRCVGRVAAFVNDKYTKQFPGVGGMGFFECINEQTAAFLLMDAARDWLASQGMEAMDGPINFGERDRFWGLIIENFERSPYYGQNYNPWYYKDFFEAYGFQVYYNQLIYYRKVHDPVQPKFEERARILAQDPRYRVKMLNKKDKTGLAKNFREVYNKAWGKREGEGFVGMSEAQARAIVNALHPIMDNKLGGFAYYDEEPIGFYIAIPDINAIFKRFNGRFGLIEKLRFLYLLKTGACKTSIGLVFGVAPDHQGKGVEALLFKECAKVIQARQDYVDVIITWIGDFNLKMVNIIESLGGQQIQKMATMRYLFDRNKPFERHPVKS